MAPSANKLGLILAKDLGVFTLWLAVGCRSYEYCVMCAGYWSRLQRLEMWRCGDGCSQSAKGKRKGRDGRKGFATGFVVGWSCCRAGIYMSRLQRSEFILVLYLGLRPRLI